MGGDQGLSEFRGSASDVNDRLSVIYDRMVEYLEESEKQDPDHESRRGMRGGMHRGERRSVWSETFQRWFAVGFGIMLGAGAGVVISGCMILILLWLFGGGM